MDKCAYNSRALAVDFGECCTIWGKGDGDVVNNSIVYNSGSDGCMLTDGQIADIIAKQSRQTRKAELFGALSNEEIDRMLGVKREEVEKVVLSGRKKRIVLRSLCTLCEVFPEYANQGHPVVSGSLVGDRRLARMFGCKSSVRNVLSCAERCGLLHRIRGAQGVVCEYAWNPGVVKMLRAMAKEMRIRVPKVKACVNLSKRVLKVPNDCHFRIAPNQRQLQRCRGISDETVIAGVCRDYPQIPFYQALLDEYNRSPFVVKNSFLEMSFVPKVTRSLVGHVSKISIRATSVFSGLRSLVNVHERDGVFNRFAVYRENVMDMMWGFEANEGDVYGCYDVKASVPRVSNALYTGCWNADNSFDFYKAMYEDVFPGLARSCWKASFMRTYFSASARKARANLIASGINPVYAGVVEDFFVRSRKAVERVVGDVVGSEIFLHESCIYIGALYRLYKMGYEVALVYDEFCYSKKHGLTEDMIAKAIEESFEEYYSKFIVSR